MTDQAKAVRQMHNRSITIHPEAVTQLVQVFSDIEADMFSILVMVGNLNRIGRAGMYDDAIQRFARRNKEQAEKLIKQLSGIRVDAIIDVRSPDTEPKKPRKSVIRYRPKSPEQKCAELQQLRDEMTSMLNNPVMSALEKLLVGNGLLSSIQQS